MKKHSLIGITICTVLVLILGASTNVLGYQIAKKTTTNTVFEKPEEALFNKMKNDRTQTDNPRHLVLFLTVWLSLQFYLFRGWILYELSISVDTFNRINVDHPVLFLRACWLIFLGEFGLKFWQQLSSARGWNWSLDDTPWYTTFLPPMPLTM